MRLEFERKDGPVGIEGTKTTPRDGPPAPRESRLRPSKRAASIGMPVPRAGTVIGARHAVHFRLCISRHRCLNIRRHQTNAKCGESTEEATCIRRTGFASTRKLIASVMIPATHFENKERDLTIFLFEVS